MATWSSEFLLFHEALNLTLVALRTTRGGTR